MPAIALTEATVPVSDLAPTPAHEIDVRVGRNLRSNRKQRGLTQKQLGAGVGLTLQQIQKYENGSNRINVSRLHQFSEILKVPVAQFFASTAENSTAGDTGVMLVGGTSVENASFSADDIELLTLFSTISPRMKRRLICLVEEMVEEAG